MEKRINVGTGRLILYFLYLILLVLVICFVLDGVFSIVMKKGRGDCRFKGKD